MAINHINDFIYPDYGGACIKEVPQIVHSGTCLTCMMASQGFYYTKLHYITMNGLYVGFVISKISMNDE